jgi:4-hydroxy-3-methylbut-2-enyl diphosphate reductase
VTAGASAPEELVRAVLDRLAPAKGVEVVTLTTEEEYFPPPRELRELLRAAALAASFSLFAPPVDLTGVLADDRAVAASDVLEDLAR